MGNIKNIFFIGTIVILLSCNCEKPLDISERKYSSNVVWSYEGVGPSNMIRPAIGNGKTFVAFDSLLVCSNLSNGEKLWEVNLQGYTASQNVIYDKEKVFLPTANKVFCFNAENGTKNWEVTLPDFVVQVLSTLTETSTHLFVAGNNGKVAKITKLNGAIELIIPLTQLIWQGYTQAAYEPIGSEIDDRLYVPTGWWTGEELRGNLLCYNSVTGEFLWGYDSKGVNGWDILGCAIIDSITVFSARHTVAALNRFTGTKLWNIEIAGDAFWLSPTIDHGTVYIGSTVQAKMYAFDLKTGTIKWTSEDTRSSIITLITVKDGKVFFCNNSRIYVLDAETGKTIWWGHPPEHDKDGISTYSSPVAVGEGYMVCVGSSKVYCLTIPK
ncbi:MAG: PQQ-binding-like beta-propeller repeat protein [Bacteroidota bacterium]